MFYDKEYTFNFGGRNLIIKTNVAKQAHGSCFVQYGETSVLGTAQASNQKVENDFFPLTVEYQERFYAAGKILGSRYTRREGRASNKAILNSRVIDRIIRPLFPESFQQETQVITTCLSWDAENSPMPISALAASISLGISQIPWNGPIGCVQVGRLNNELILNPNYDQSEKGDFHITLGAFEKNGELLINMIEATSNQIPEQEILEAIRFAYNPLKEQISWQKQIIKEIGQPKMEVASIFPDADLEKRIRAMLGNQLTDLGLNLKDKQQAEKLSEIKQTLIKDLSAEYPSLNIARLIENFFEKEIEILIHKLAIEKDSRVDGRKLDELRTLTAKVGLLPRTHGTGFFSRGETQALSILTLGAPGDQQEFEGMDYIGKKRYIHHYNFPPYSSGEVKPLRGPGRREIGHGQLAENALLPVLPSQEQFPYTIRIVTEIVSSNGSTSMASTCGSTLALMDAGVPIIKPVAGISIGLMHAQKIPGQESSRQYKLLTDIQGPEDHYGDMDFKVAGTDSGITAIQLDVKLDGLSDEIIEETFKRSKEARTKVLATILATIDQPRQSLSPYAPIIITAKINPEKIGEVIGPKGKNINDIIDRLGVIIDIEDSGFVYITSSNAENAKKALAEINAIAKDFEIGEIIEGKVVKIMEFGAFVELNTSTDGLVHISELAPFRVKNVSDIVKEGDVIKVKIIGKDGEKIKLSLKAALKDATMKP